MARPQFRRLEYDLFESLMRAKLPGSTYQVVLVVIDHTVGYRKRNAGISLSRFQEKTKLSRWGVVKAIHDAERRNIIKVEREKTSAKVPAIYELKTDYQHWVTSQRQLPGASQPQLHRMPVNISCSDQSTAVAQTSQHLMPATPTERNLKETIKKDTTPPEMSFLDKSISAPPLENTSTLAHTTPTVRGTSLRENTPSLKKNPTDTLPRADEKITDLDTSCLRGNYVSFEGVTLSFPGENNATSSRRTLVTEYLGLHGQSQSKDIASHLGLTPLQMSLFFSQHKRYFRSIQRGVWALRGEGD